MTPSAAKVVFNFCDEALNFARRGNLYGAVQCLQHAHRFAEDFARIADRSGRALDYSAVWEELADTARECRSMLLYPKDRHNSMDERPLDAPVGTGYAAGLRASSNSLASSWDKTEIEPRYTKLYQ